MKNYINVQIESNEALNMLVDRVEYWTDDRAVVDLFAQMYENYIDNGCFAGGEFDVMSIVDNDYINYTQVIRAGDEDFEKVLKLYKKDGLGDVSCEEFDYYKINYIEAVDNEDDPSMFLVRL